MDTLPELAPFQRRLDELNAQMAAPSFYANLRRAADVTREQQKLGSWSQTTRPSKRSGASWRETRALAQDPAADPDLRELAAQELPDLERRRAALRETVLLAMIPPEPTDSRNTVMEIRAGTGGDEAALFAAELARLYQKYADAHGWKVEPMGSSVTERGGLQGGELPHQRAGRLQAAQVRERSPPRAARAGDRGQRPDSHIDRHRRRAARGRGGRRAHRSAGTGDHGAARKRPGRAGGQHDRLGGAHHPQAHGNDCFLRRRAFAAEEQGQRNGGAPVAAAQAQGGRGEGKVRGAAPRPNRQRRPFRAHPHVQLSPEPR